MRRNHLESLLHTLLESLCRQIPMARTGAKRLALASMFLCHLYVTVEGQSAGEWPPFPMPGPHQIERGPGFYFSIVKVLLLLGLFWLWMKTTDWVSRDCQRNDLSYALWNPLVFFPFFCSLFLFGFSIPIFPVGFGLCVLAYAAPSIAYVIVRNKNMEMHERVMTPGHIRHLIAEMLGKIGIKITSQGKAAHEKGAPVTMVARGAANDQLNQANLIAARQTKGYLQAKDLIASAVDHRAEKIMMDFTAEAAHCRFLVDGVWHDSEQREREESDGILTVFKRISALKPEDRRSRQQGRFGAEYGGRKIECSVVSQGTKTGERVLVTFARKDVAFTSLEDLGMRDKMVEKFKELMLNPNGILVFSAVPAGGLSTTMYLSLKSTDRLLRDFVVVEDEADPLREVENVDPMRYKAAAGETPDQQLDRVFRKQPDVIIVPQLPNAETVIKLCEGAEENHLMFVTVRAKEAVEALLRILLLKVPASKFAPVVIGVLNQRLVRKLCEACKEEYQPPPDLLKKLGIPAGRVEKLYRHPENPEKECKVCSGIGYIGRTGIFELLVVENTIREALIKTPKLETLRLVARKAGHRSLQEEGLAKVVQGITSLAELMRALKE
jgi:type II secretory ATPase GspE/PulE/Tfp pilus assembly ATPase PilB-like protein